MMMMMMVVMMMTIKCIYDDDDDVNDVSTYYPTNSWSCLNDSRQ